MDRPRVRRALDNAIDYPMIVVCAGSGYGKTREVYSYLQSYDANTTWLQLSERDNVPTRFWESFTHMVSRTWPETGENFREIGFPQSDEVFARYAELRAETLAPVKKYVLVYDDFHVLYNPDVLRFIQKAAITLPSNGTVVIISRTMPDVNIIGMIMNERVFIIREDTLCFTEDEITEYFNQLAINISRRDIRDVYEDTQGWAFAVNLIGRSLLKDMKYKRHTLEVMKENIYNFIESEVASNIEEPLCNFLLRISLIDNHAASLIKSIANNDEELIRKMETVNAYIRYDFYLGTYMIHHLFLGYLRLYNDTLSEEDVRDTYHKAGVWSENDNYLTDALSYYEKAGDYDAVLKLIYSFNVQVPQDMARFALEIVDRMPIEATGKPLYPAMKLKLKMGLGLMEEASALAQSYVEEYEARPDSPDKYRALAEIYNIWAVLRMIMSPYTDIYDFDVYFEKQRKYYDMNPYAAYGPSTNQPVGAYALLIGTNRAGAPEEYIKALARAIPHASHALKGNLYGLDDLAQGEIYFYQRKIDLAEQFMIQAQEKALARGQYDIRCRAMQYQMLIALSQGDIGAADEVLAQLETLLDEKEYISRYEAYDIALAHYYCIVGQPERIPDWLKTDFSPYAHPAFAENYINRIKAQYRYLTRRYSELLAFLENVKETQTLLLGKIVFEVLKALTLYQLKRKDEAIYALSEAYALAAPNKIITPFTQYTKAMRTLTATALKDSNCKIPKDWLEDINRKSSAFAKRTAHMMSRYKNMNNIADGISLTKRETEVLKELSLGLSRAEIAVSQGISVNTVKMVINILYEKLGVNSLPEAIRVALEHKII